MPPKQHEGEGLHLSATRIKTFRQTCERLWGWQYLAGMLVPSTDAHAFGSEMHLSGELYLRDGRVPGSPVPLSQTPKPTERGDKLFTTGIHLWPAPSKAHRVEWSFAIPLGNGQTFTGTMDFARPDGFRAIPAALAGRAAAWAQVTRWARGLPFLGDHKSTNDFRWALTPESLIADVQSTSYAHRLMDVTGAREVAKQWVYYHKKKRVPAMPVRAIITRDQARSQWARTLEAADRMVDLWQRQVDPMTLAPNGEPDSDHAEPFSACDAYGGCHFRDMCRDRVNHNSGRGLTLESFQQEESRMSTGQQSKLFSKFANRGGTPKPVEAAPQPPPAAPAPTAARLPLFNKDGKAPPSSAPKPPAAGTGFALLDQATAPPEASAAELEKAMDADNGELESDQTHSFTVPSINAPPIELTPEQQALLAKHEAEAAAAVAPQEPALKTEKPKRLGKKKPDPAGESPAPAEVATEAVSNVVVAELVLKEMRAEIQRTTQTIVTLAARLTEMEIHFASFLGALHRTSEAYDKRSSEVASNVAA